jgi:hypothetical protein
MKSETERGDRDRRAKEPGKKEEENLPSSFFALYDFEKDRQEVIDASVLVIDGISSMGCSHSSLHLCVFFEP